MRVNSTFSRPRSIIRHCRTTVGQSTQSLLEQTDFDSAVGLCLVTGENDACQIPIRHNTLSDGDVKVCLIVERGLYLLDLNGKGKETLGFTSTETIKAY